MLLPQTVLLSTLKRSLTHPTGNLGSKQLRHMATHSPAQLLEMVKSVIPALHPGMHKGQAGRVAIIGGCQEYTGAPYFAAISALKVGADLAHVFCSLDAAPVIKSYSPELIVHPLLDNPDAVSQISQWLPRFHSLVVGPGLGRDNALLKTAMAVIRKAMEQSLPLVIDADGLFLVTQDPSLVQGYTNAILTPNAAEFGRLYKTIFDHDPDPSEPIISVKELCRKLGHVTVVHKGVHDIISNGEQDSQSILQRVETQRLRNEWLQCLKTTAVRSLLMTYGPGICAAYAACSMTRVCNRRAFEVSGRSTTTTDMISQIHASFQHLFE